jgi:hypothetical protein
MLNIIVFNSRIRVREQMTTDRTYVVTEKSSTDTNEVNSSFAIAPLATASTIQIIIGAQYLEKFSLSLCE